MMAILDPTLRPGATERHDPTAVSARCAAVIDYALGLDLPLVMERTLRAAEVWDKPDTGSWVDEPMDVDAAIASVASTYAERLRGDATRAMEALFSGVVRK